MFVRVAVTARKQLWSTCGCKVKLLPHKKAKMVKVNPVVSVGSERRSHITPVVYVINS